MTQFILLMTKYLALLLTLTCCNKLYKLQNTAVKVKLLWQRRNKRIQFIGNAGYGQKELLLVKNEAISVTSYCLGMYTFEIFWQ